MAKITDEGDGMIIFDARPRTELDEQDAEIERLKEDCKYRNRLVHEKNRKILDLQAELDKLRKENERYGFALRAISLRTEDTEAPYRIMKEMQMRDVAIKALCLPTLPKETK